jgi:hypothetical protein
MKMHTLTDGRTISDLEAKEIIFEAFNRIKDIDGLPVRNKVRAFEEVRAMIPGWRVVGITQNALEVFKKLNYKRPPGRGEDGVNRSHKHARSATYASMFEKYDWSFAEFWNFIDERDTTILATTKENYSKGEEISAYDVPAGLFEAYGFAYRVNEREIEFLKGL